MALSHAHRTSIYESFVPILGTEEAEALMAEFPSTELDVPATKDFVAASINEVRLEVNEVRLEVEKLRDEMHREIDGLRDEMHREIDGVRLEVKDLRAEMHKLLNRQTWMLMGMVFTSQTIFATVLGLVLGHG